MRSALSRRRLLTLSGATAATLAVSGTALGATLLTGCGSSNPAAAEEESAADHAGASEVPLTATQVLARLGHGNKRFVGGNAIHPDQSQNRRKELATAQHPIAIVLSCVDSRVPPELIFDEGLGGLFVIRTAGQAVDHAVLGSIQFGVHELHVPVLMVLGHSACGAVKATIEAVEKQSEVTGTDLDTLYAAIKPSLVRAKEHKPADLVAATVRENIKTVVTTLTHATIIADTVAEKKLTVVGAHYDLASGVVEVFKE